MSVKNLTSRVLPLIFLSATSAMAEDKAPITIGIQGPINGPFAAIGADMMAAARAAQDKINAGGGVLGHPLNLVAADDQCSGKDAVNAANKLVADGVNYVIGGYCSGATIPASQVYNEAGIVQITMSQALAVTQHKYQNLFRITPNVEALSSGYIKTVQDEYRLTNSKIGIAGANDQYARDISETLQQKLKTVEVPVAAIEHYNPDDRDFSSLITKLKSAGVNLVLLSGSEQQMGLIVRQSADLGFKTRFIVSSTALSSDFTMLAGGCAAKGVRTVAAWNPLYAQDPANQALLADLRGHGVNGIDTAINVYSAVIAMAQAMEKAGSLDPVAVTAALHHESFDLPIGTTQFTDSGELAAPRTITYEFQSDSHDCLPLLPRPVAP